MNTHIQHIYIQKHLHPFSISPSCTVRSVLCTEICTDGPPGLPGTARTPMSLAAPGPGRSEGYLPGWEDDTFPALLAGRRPPPAPPRDQSRVHHGAAPLTAGPARGPPPPASRAGLGGPARRPVRRTGRSACQRMPEDRARVGPDGLGAGALWPFFRQKHVYWATWHENYIHIWVISRVEELILKGIKFKTETRNN